VGTKTKGNSMSNEIKTTIINIKSEDDIDVVMKHLFEGNGIGFQIDASVEREEHFRLMNVINERYKAMNNNSVRSSEEVA
jgi:hypothetical protein